MKVGIVIDTWKLKIFTEHLDNAGIVFEQEPGPVADCLSLFVEACIGPEYNKLQTVVMEATTACKISKLN